MIFSYSVSQLKDDMEEWLYFLSQYHCGSLKESVSSCYSQYWERNPGLHIKAYPRLVLAFLRWVQTWFVVVDIVFGPQERQGKWGRWSILMRAPPSADFVMVVYFFECGVRMCVCIYMGMCM